jgi:hypothetical protein
MVVYDRTALFKKKLHFIMVNVELEVMEIAKNKEGKLNVDSLKIVRQPDSSPLFPLQIDLLTFSIGQLVYKDFSVRG